MKKYIILTVLICISSALFSQNPTVYIQRDTLPSGAINVTAHPEGGLWSKYILLPDNYGTSFDFNYFSDNTGLSETGDDYLISNQYSPDNFGGCLSLDACYNSTQNKLYFYGGQNIIVVDALTNSKIKEIKVSEEFSHLYASALNRKDSHYLAYNPQYNKVFCATLSADLVIIDCNTDEIVNVIHSPEIYNFNSTSVGMDLDGDFLYWYVNDTFTYRFLNKIDCQTNNRVSQRGFDGGIFDIVCDYNDSIIYLSTFSNAHSKIHAISTSNLQTITQFGKANMGKMVVNEATNILYVDDLESCRVLAYDLNTYAQVDAINVSFDFLSQGTCNSSEDLIYFTGFNESLFDGGLIIIDGSIGQEVKAYPGDWCTIGLVYDENMDVVFYSYQDKIAVIDGADYNQLYHITTNEGGKSVRLISGQGESVISANLNEGTATVFDLQSNSHGKQLVLNSLIQLGGNMELGCYNEMNEKAYYIQHSSTNKQSYLSIIDVNTLSNIAEIPIGSTIRDVKYNSHNNKVYLTLFDDKKIIPIDGESNQILTNQIINLPHEPIEVFFSSGNKIYVSCYNFIYVIDGYTHQTLNTIVAQGWKHFEENTISHIIYASQYGYPIITAIDAITNQKIADIALSGSEVSDMCYSEYDNSVFVSYFDVKKIDVISGTSLSSTINTINEVVFLEFNNFEEKVYALGGSVISVIKLNTVIKTIDLHGICQGLIYNSINNKIYFHMLFDINDFYSKIIAIDCTTDEICSIVKLPQKQVPGLIFITIKNDLVFSKSNNRIFCGTRAFSSICGVQCNTDHLWLQNSWNWISFPRMERTGNNYSPSIPVLERINYFPNLEATLWDQGLKKKFWINDVWTGFLNNVRSTDGYKLELDLSPGDGYVPKIALHGAKLNPNTPITLYPNQENWVGYFIESAQYPWEAFPSGLYNNQLTMIKSQYWTMTKYNGQWIGNKVTPIKYGDMVILEINGQLPVSFMWNNSTTSSEGEELLKAEHYSFEEQSDYIPIYIQIDTPDEFREIAVIADGECVGAVACIPGDTLVELNAYLQGIPQGTPLEFGTWTSYKSDKIGADDYAVMNASNGHFEKRQIFKGESAPFYMVSFKKSETTQSASLITGISCSPNPFDIFTTFNFSLTQNSDAELTIYDLVGNRVYTVINGNLAAGYYSFKWNGNTDSGNRLNNGVYIYKIKTANGELFLGKVVIIR